MLRRLSLRDVVIVTQLDLEVAGGFTVLTGETGAGKSILIDALQLALGNRADPTLVREGAARAEVSAEFDVPPSLAPWLDAGGFGPADDALLVRRSIDAQGRSRAWINGSAATVAQLREMAEHLVDIHGQHAWQGLTRPPAVRALLDEQAGVDAHALAQAWQAWRGGLARLDEARAQRDTLERERERLVWQIGELDRLAPQPNEWDELSTEHQRLAHGQALLDAARAALQALSDDEPGADALLSRAGSAIDEVLRFDAELAGVAEVLRSAQLQVQDAVHSLQAYLGHRDPDPDRLAELDARMGSWMALARRYRRAPAELPDLLAGWKDELRRLDASADLERLEREADAGREQFLTLARSARVSRQRAARSMAQAVTAAMQGLGMAGGRFEVALVPLDEPQSHGLDQIELRVAGHAGSSARPLAKVASGGELSRLALAVAVTTCRAGGGSGVSTLIFDEIDSGVGGGVADAVGRLMKQLGRQVQVLAVTHLAQVAACADHHLVVSKTSRGGATFSDMRAVAGEARVAEIARMLGGESLSGTAHAQAMLARGSEPETST